MNCVDLGIVTSEEARGRVSSFSYPFGRRHQITEESRALVQQAGYGCCLLAHDGWLSPGDSPFKLQRTPVSRWHISPYQFGFETMIEHA